MQGRLITVLHSLRAQDVSVELPHGVYVGRWEGQERVFRDMRACQNLDANYGQKKVAVPSRPQERKREDLSRKLQTCEKQVATAQRKVQEYTERNEALEQEAQQKQAKNQAEVAALRQAGWEATTPKKRERLLLRAERLAAKSQIQQVRLQERRRRLVAHQRSWQQKLAERQSNREKVAQAFQELAEDHPFYDFDLEKDNLMTYLRMAGENAHRFVQEQYFAGTLLEKVDEATMARLVYHLCQLKL